MARSAHRLDEEPPTPACGKKLGLIDRGVVSIGLERVAKAQSGCNFSICNGCYTKIQTFLCGGPCPPFTYTQNY